LPSTSPNPTIALRLLATSDLHLNLLEHDYYTDRPRDHGGLSRLVGTIATARAEAANCLLLDNGDSLQGTPMGDMLACQPPPGAPGAWHPMIRAMNHLGYDAATLGNHEFNWGLEHLSAMVRGAGFAIVCANIHPIAGPICPQWALLERDLADSDGVRHRLCIGVVGFAPPQVMQWDRLHLESRAAAEDILDAARRVVPQLRAAGADLVVALCHSGLTAPTEPYHSETAAGHLAALPGVDAVVAGHSHLTFPGPGFAGLPPEAGASGLIAGCPVVMPGANGSHLGLIDLSVQHRHGRWSVQSARASLREAEAAPADPALARLLAADHARTLAFVRQSVGHSRIGLSTHFALLRPTAAMGLIAAAQTAHLRKALTGRPEAGLPLLSAVAPFKAGGRAGADNFTHIPAGDLSLRHVSDLYMFPNRIAALILSGAEIADWLEHAAGLYHRLDPASADQPLIDPDYPSYNFDLLAGVSFGIDLSQPRRFDRHGMLLDPQARRIRNLTLAGRPLAPDERLLVATNSYRAAGSGGFAGALPDRQIDLDPVELRDVLTRHIAAASPLRPRWQGGWTLQAPAGTRAWFDTAATAAPGRPSASGPRLCRRPGLTQDGFARYDLIF
jgi:2',3'-cyclic-nucleotide 2'-phosphodiesterase/3'-nucleotidase